MIAQSRSVLFWRSTEWSSRIEEYFGIIGGAAADGAALYPPCAGAGLCASFLPSYGLLLGVVVTYRHKKIRCIHKVWIESA